jgi:hypothetical protein
METFQILQKPSDSDNNESIRNQKCLSAIPTFLVMLIAMIILNVFVYYMDSRLPGIIETNSTNNVFVAKRAMSTLIKLANIGPRPVGSFENENLAFNLFKTEIEHVEKELDNVNDIVVYNQKVTGSFILDMRNWKYLLSYEDLQNVVVKIDPKQGASDAILLNCHFDSVPAGPGVSDNGVNCAVMVELLRVLTKSSELRRPVIFLFNGGEEIILQASHGFVTQHPWSQDAKYVINLDSCGAGGKEIMFQTTERDSYLVDVYARSVPHPHGQVMGQELFQSGVIPSDTDFRIFRDFGNMSGLDLAHYKNGYVYHTEYDNLDQVEPSVLQNTGENLLELVKAMSTRNATTTSKSHRTKYVFFDVLGVYMFSYTELSGAFFNFIIVLVSFFSVFLTLRFVAAGMNRREYTVHLLTSIVSPGCTLVLSVLSCALVAFILDSLGYSMSWYAHKTNLVVYYATASLTTLSVVVFHPKKNRSRTDAELTISAFNGIQFFWTVLLFLSTMAGLRSSYLFMVMVLWPSATNCILGFLGAHRTPGLWIAVYAASLLVPITFVFYLTQLFVSLFVPITGRFGPHVNPDYIVGVLIAMSTYATIGYLSPVFALVKNPRALLVAVGTLALLSAVAIVATPLGFPYSGGAVLPKNQRFDVTLTRRTFYESDGSVRRNDSGYLIVNWDRQSPGSVANSLPEMARAVRTDCAAELLCGMPLVGQLVYHSSWIPHVSARPAADNVAAELPSATNTEVVVTGTGDHRRRRMHFNITGPERINVYVSPYPGTRLTSWSFSGKPEVTTTWQGHDVYVIRHSRAGESDVWRFWLEHESSYGFDENTINVTVAFNWVVHKRLVLVDAFRTFLDSFPRWAHVNHAVASVDAFVY